MNILKGKPKDKRKGENNKRKKLKARRKILTPTLKQLTPTFQKYSFPTAEPAVTSSAAPPFSEGFGGKKSASSECRTSGLSSRDCVSERTVPFRNIFAPSFLDILFPAAPRFAEKRTLGPSLAWELYIQAVIYLPLPP